MGSTDHHLMNTKLALIPILLSCILRLTAEPIHVLVWDERQKRQAEAYDNFLGNEIPMTEMYDEPFHIPAPDEVVFEEDWKLGEHFRSGMVWNLGKGQIFYFRPGHEQYPVFKQDEMIRILANACLWMGGE